MMAARTLDSQLILKVEVSSFTTLDAILLIFISDNPIFFCWFAGLCLGCSSQYLSIEWYNLSERHIK